MGKLRRRARGKPQGGFRQKMEMSQTGPQAHSVLALHHLQSGGALIAVGLGGGASVEGEPGSGTTPGLGAGDPRPALQKGPAHSRSLIEAARGPSEGPWEWLSGGWSSHGVQAQGSPAFEQGRQRVGELGPTHALPGSPLHTAPRLGLPTGAPVCLLEPCLSISSLSISVSAPSRLSPTTQIWIAPFHHDGHHCT